MLLFTEFIAGGFQGVERQVIDVFDVVIDFTFYAVVLWFWQLYYFRFFLSKFKLLLEVIFQWFVTEIDVTALHSPGK